MDDFSQQIYSQVYQIPIGKISTYGDIAKFSGFPGYARQVGRLLSNLPQGSTLPWHRVINSKGSISLCGDGRARQIEALRNEGVIVTEQGRVSLKAYRWDGYPE
ncbi:MGMT family protein [Photobacterium angustum]|uniref:Putative methylated DNA-proteincysteine methyltransferase n=1 Tax=Photobacterium angustum (strain S14 / CCUG 15956) TaxID=314292 RepID=Q1ZPA8_PHOAS|nr:MGMT family protein [Photobacterium angustum]EAS64052.1 putative methylated DNA-proteincysteine methyltransferase [Photobacterium angustum S14]